MFTLSANLHDAQARIETFRSELNDTRDHLHKVEQIRDRLDMELNFEQHMSAMSGVKREALYSPHSHKNHKHLPDLICVHGKVRHDEYFPEGGQHTTWITDGSSTLDWEDDYKENSNPLTEHHHPFGSTTLSVKPQQQKYVSAKQSPNLSQLLPLASTSSFTSPVRTFPTTAQEETLEKPQAMTLDVGHCSYEI